MTDPALDPDPWRARLFNLTLVRLAGIMVAFLGLVWAATGKFGTPQPVAGAILIVVGLVGSLLLARRMRQNWLKPPE
jgi:hypothetical protein